MVLSAPVDNGRVEVGTHPGLRLGDVLAWIGGLFALSLVLFLLARQLAVSRRPWVVTEVQKVGAAEGVAFTGRFFDPDGRPVAGVEFFVVRFIHDEGKEPEPWSWSNRSTISGSDGRFRLPTSLYPDAQIEVAARHPDWLELHWPFMSLKHAHRAELGDIQLERPGKHRLLLEDADGKPIQTNWIWAAKSERVDLADEADPTTFLGVGTSFGGVLTLTGLPAGTSANIRLFSLAEGEAPVPTNVDEGIFVVGQGDVGSDVVAVDGIFAESDKPMPPIVLFQEEATAVGGSRVASSLEVLGPDGRAVEVVLDGPAAIVTPRQFGPHQVRFADPRFDNWERTNVMPGEWLHVGLDGSASLHVVGTDPVSRERLAGSRAWFSVPEEWSHYIGWRTGEFHEEHLIDHLLPGSIELTIEYSDGTVEVLPPVDVGPREQVEVRIGAE